MNIYEIYILVSEIEDVSEVILWLEREGLMRKHMVGLFKFF